MSVRQTGPAPGPTVLDGLSLLAEVGDELVVRSARDTHLAVLDRVDGVRRLVAGPRSGARPSRSLHRGVAGAVYGVLGAGLRGAARGLDAAAATGSGPRLDDSGTGRFVTAAVNGLIGDRLHRERPRLAIPLAVRHEHRDVALTGPALRTAFPDASGRVVVFLHGLCEDESYWRHRRQEVGTTYGEALAARGWTPVFLRANTGLSLRENGVGLAALLRDLVVAWPVEVTRLALVGHSMGGLVARAAGSVATEPGVPGRSWTDLVSDVVTLGTPHLGAPLARGVGHGSRGLGVLPETAAFGRVLDWRSVGVLNLVTGLAEDVPPLPHASYRLVAATLTRSARHPVGRVVGDLLVRVPSAVGRDPWGRELFPDATVLHVGATDHFGLLNHPRVHEALAEWLA